MYGRFLRVAAGTLTASLLAAGGGGAQTALAGSRSVVQVPCSAAALTAAVSSASSGETLSLATLCTYGLTSALPPIMEKLTIKGNHATIEGQGAGAPGLRDPHRGRQERNGHRDPGGQRPEHQRRCPRHQSAQWRRLREWRHVLRQHYRHQSNFFTTLHVSGATFTSNSGEDSRAIFGTASVSVTDSTFTGNSAERAARCISRKASRNSRRLCQFTGNTATAAGGGLYDDGNITMTDTTFSSNHARGRWGNDRLKPISAGLAVTGSALHSHCPQTGGAIYNFDGLTATDSVFTANHATQGGAVNQDWFATLSG